jgi:Tol biopolymer transport system component
MRRHFFLLCAGGMLSASVAWGADPVPTASPAPAPADTVHVTPVTPAPTAQPGASLVQPPGGETAEGPGDASTVVAPAAPVVTSPTLGGEDLHPHFVHPLLPDAEVGHNDSNPVWAPSGTLLAFERSVESKREILVARVDGGIVKRVRFEAAEDDAGLGLLMPELTGTASYNSGLTWAPSGQQFVFMGNGGEGNYDLYLDTISGKGAQRLTRDPQKDGQPDWSPVEDAVVFVSGRTGAAMLYILDLPTRRTTRLTDGDQGYLYPRWSPNGRRIAAIYGSNENHDIVVVDEVRAPLPVRRRLTTWEYDDLSPTWSPDGRKLAFYSNYNGNHDSKVWCIVVIDADGTAPTGGPALAARVVAENVIPDVATGPAWSPDGKRIVYVRNDKQDYSPIYVVDVASRVNRKLVTGTNINHDVSCSRQGLLAFRAQVDQWDRIYLAAIDPPERP